MTELMEALPFIINVRGITFKISDIVLRVMRLGGSNSAIHLWEQTIGVIIKDYGDSPKGTARFVKCNPNAGPVLEQHGEIVGTLPCGNDGRRGLYIIS